MAVGSGRYKHPEGASPALIKLIDAMLVVDPEKRPDIQTVRHLHDDPLFYHNRPMTGLPLYGTAAFCCPSYLRLPSPRSHSPLTLLCADPRSLI